MTGDRKANIAMVAREAKVAKSSVSRVLNGGSVSDDMRLRVNRVIEKLGYRPSTTARNFSLSRAGSVGVVVEDSSGGWFTEVLKGVEEETNLNHYALLLGSLTLKGAFDLGVVNAWVEDRRVDELDDGREISA